MRAGKNSSEEAKELSESVQNIEINDRGLLLDIKSVLLEGLACFEQHEDQTIEHAKEKLIKIIHQYIPSIFRKFFFVEREICGQYIKTESQESEQTDQQQAKEHQEPILTNTYWELEKLASEDVLILRRTPVNISSLPPFLESNEELIKTFPKYKNFGIVVDMRQAQGRNDPEFEDSMMNLRINIYTNFARVAVLLMSKTGVLQVNRIGRNEGVENFATVSESAAVRFAKGAA